ncbi:uncharacterized protein LOC100904628 [Galendromus occidentalis]|uniref:Uncharacterized protein LOC100904628 n=1 Tax=Galendromus occidentalis TaxID=34638 RepID=A0AAJ6QXF8_9ACAR|nr:uncharacterized protein LOC100904628 [Galendromus occidentalis]
MLSSVVDGDVGIDNAAYSATEMDSIGYSYGSKLMVHQESLTLSTSVNLAHTAEIFGKSGLPVSIGPKDPSQFLTPLSFHSQLDIFESIGTQPRPGSFTRSFQVNGEDMSALYSLNLTIIYKNSPRSRILANLKDRAGDCVAIFRGPEGTQGCVCCCTRCAQGRMRKRQSIAMLDTGTIFLNPQESLTVESPPGSVVGHIALHHDFYGIYDKGMLTLLYSVPFKGDAGAHPINLIDGAANRQPGRVSCTESERALKINVRPPLNINSTQHKLLFIATAMCMFGMEIDRIPRPLEWLGCISLRNAIEDGFC